jgi:hypothetical protein
MNVLSALVAFSLLGITPLGWSTVPELRHAAMATGVHASIH